MWVLLPLCAVNPTGPLGGHNSDFIMGTMASQITSLTIVYSTVYSDADQRKHQSSASLTFVWGIHRSRWIPGQMTSSADNVYIWWRHHGNPVDSPTKRPGTRSFGKIILKLAWIISSTNSRVYDDMRQFKSSGDVTVMVMKNKTQQCRVGFIHVLQETQFISSRKQTEKNLRQVCTNNIFSIRSGRFHLYVFTGIIRTKHKKTYINQLMEFRGMKWFENILKLFTC